VRKGLTGLENPYINTCLGVKSKRHDAMPILNYQREGTAGGEYSS